MLKVWGFIDARPLRQRAAGGERGEERKVSGPAKFESKAFHRFLRGRIPRGGRLEHSGNPGILRSAAMSDTERLKLRKRVAWCSEAPLKN